MTTDDVLIDPLEAALLGATIVDVTPGELATVVPPLVGPTFLRLTRPAGRPVDTARAVYLLAATPAFRAATPGGLGGFGLAVLAPAAVDRARLAHEVHEVGIALRALADPDVAQRYLDLVAPRLPAHSGRAITLDTEGD